MEEKNAKYEESVKIWKKFKKIFFFGKTTYGSLSFHLRSHQYDFRIPRVKLSLEMCKNVV
jgi:hypothetical protein